MRGSYTECSHVPLVKILRDLRLFLMHAFHRFQQPQGKFRPLDALVLADQPTFPGCIVRARPVAVLHMEDYNGLDEKILCACADDPRQDDVQNLDSVPKHLLTEIENFFEIYKTLEVDKPTTLRGWGARKDALAIIKQAQKAYASANRSP